MDYQIAVGRFLNLLEEWDSEIPANSNLGLQSPVRIYKNPSQSELLKCRTYDQVRAILLHGDMYVWKDAVHHKVARHLSLDKNKDVIPVHMYIHKGLIVGVNVTDYVNNTKWKNNPKVEQAIKDNNYIVFRSDPEELAKDDFVSYYNEAIVGAWTELKEESADLQEILEKIKNDPELKQLLEKGTPRPGHPEGKYKLHAEEVLRNIEKMNLTEDDRLKLEILAWVHDAFKSRAKAGAIEDPQSHGSLASAYLSKFTNDQELLNIAKYHDYPHSLYKRSLAGKNVDVKVKDFLDKFKSTDLLIAFNKADAKTGDKEQDSLNWWLNKIKNPIEEMDTGGQLTANRLGI